MFHNPGGDWHPGRGDNPRYHLFAKVPWKFLWRQNHEHVWFARDNFFQNVRHAVQLFFLSSLTLSTYVLVIRDPI